MKKFLFLALAGMALVSCSQEEVKTEAESATMAYTFTVNLPEDLSTRAFGDGTTASSLYVYLYDLNTETQALDFNWSNESEPETFENGSVTLTLILNPKQAYKVAFLAAAPDAMNEVFTFDENNQTLSVDYRNMTADGMNGDLYDLFYNTATIQGINSGNVSNGLVLTRAMAQLNWGVETSTDDTTGDSSSTVISTSLSITKGAYNTLNVFTGNVTADDSTEATVLPTTPVPTDETYPVEGFQYIAMQYVLAPGGETSGTLDLELTITETTGDSTDETSKTVPMSSVPVKANYQTNIYGDLDAANTQNLMIETLFQ